MKIVELCPYAMDRPGGVQNHVRDLAAWLDANGHETRIVAPPAAGRAPIRRGNLIELGRSRTIGVHGTGFEVSVATPWALRRLMLELQDWGAEAVHAHTPWTPFLVRQLTHRLSMPVVTTIHATLPADRRVNLIDRYIRRTARAAMAESAVVTVPSTAPLPMLEALAPDRRFQIVAPCVDLARFAPGEKRAGLCLFLGRLEPRKGLDILLEAWPRVQAAVPSARLVIAGDGPLRDRARGLPNVDCLGAPDDAQLRQLLAASELFLAPAPYGESYGLVLAEAMASGAVPVAAANAGYAAVLADRPGLLVPPNDAAALAARAIKLLRDNDQRAADAAWGIGAAQSSDVRHAGRQYAQLFERAAARH